MNKKHLNRMKRLFKSVTGRSCKNYKEVVKIYDETVYELKNENDILYILLYNGDITTYSTELDCFID